MEQNRTERSGGGQHLLCQLAFGLALSYLRLSVHQVLYHYYCSTITRSVRRSKAPARCQSLCHITHIHSRRYMSIHHFKCLVGLAVALRKKESCQSRAPLAPKNPVLMPVQSM